ncbi:MAG: hypothetical protein ACYTEL_23580 [Planctomycetota bacterium]|jgi:hypothetical protein
MRRAIAIAAICSLLLIVTVSNTAAEVPQMINYQGRLTDDAGEPLDTVVDMVFSICSDSLGSSCAWTELQEDVEVTDGLFNVKLGSVDLITDDVFSGDERWLGINVGGESLPYTQLITTPYAYRVSTIDGAAGGIVSGRINKTRFSAGAVSDGNSTVVADLTGMNMEHGQVHFGSTLNNQWVDMWFIYSNNFLMGNYIKFDGSTTTHGHFRMASVSSGVILYSNTNESNSAGYAYWDGANHDVLIYETSAANNYCEYWYRDWSNAQ